MNKSVLSEFFKKTSVIHIVFWVIVFAYHVITVNWSIFNTLRSVIDSKLIITCLQIIIAYSTLFFLIPNYLNKKRHTMFVLMLIVLFFLCLLVYHMMRIYYLEVHYPEVYSGSEGYNTLLERMFHLQVAVSKIVYFSSPTGLLLLYHFYKKQQRLTKINEQKRIAELSALKHQLNPHFLFNTLNNLYALAINKSSKTPDVIEKLSNILDYMLYRCNDTFVPLSKEIELIENYIALEKVRYGKRVSISFTHPKESHVNIAPLILLTFIENAFKHGVSQELEHAYISMNLDIADTQIVFSIENSISKNNVEKPDKKPIGLNNVKKQLSLVYQEKYSLDIITNETTYKLVLALESK